MKTYEEMTKSVLDKVQKHREVHRRRNSYFAFAAVCTCCVLAVMAFFLQDKEIGNTDIKLQGPTDGAESNITITKTEEPRLVLLCAPSRNDTPTVMKEKIKIPYKGELRVSNISGMTEEEKHRLGKEEAAYISELWGDFADESGFGRYMLDNVMVTTISVGEFGIKIDDIDMVARIRISVTENGALLSYPRVEGCKTSAYTFEDGQQLLIDIDGKSLKECLLQNEGDTLGLFWHISPWSVTKLDENPEMDLSLFSDQITIQIDYTDGREEVTTVCMHVESDGKIYTVLEGTQINA